MGKTSLNKKGRIIGSSPTGRIATHEPKIPQDWPHGHVGVELTGDEHMECIKVRIHGVDHFLHSTTARELSNMLLEKIELWNRTKATIRV